MVGDQRAHRRPRREAYALGLECSRTDHTELDHGDGRIQRVERGTEADLRAASRRNGLVHQGYQHLPPTLRGRILEQHAHYSEQARVRTAERVAGPRLVLGKLPQDPCLRWPGLEVLEQLSASTLVIYILLTQQQILSRGVGCELGQCIRLNSALVVIFNYARLVVLAGSHRIGFVVSWIFPRCEMPYIAAFGLVAVV